MNSRRSAVRLLARVALREPGPILLAAWILVLGSAQETHGQVLIAETAGPPWLGPALAAPGDVNGDLVPDVASAATDTAGAVFVRFLSGLDGALIRDATGLASGPQPPLPTMDSAGDVNGDGVGDLVLGIPGGLGQAGRVLLVSGADASLLQVITLPLPPGIFGALGIHVLVAGVGDVDGDGHGDFAVGEPQQAPPGVTIRSGASFQVIRSLTLSPGSGVTLVGAAGDMDADGTPDVLVGDLAAFSGAGAVSVFSGSSGTSILQVVGATGNPLGIASTPVGDWNNDGFDDVAVTSLPGPVVITGQHLHVLGGGGAGLLMSGAAFLMVGIGSDVAWVSDVNADGVRDFVLTPNPFNLGSPELVSGADLQPLGPVPGLSFLPFVPAGSPARVVPLEGSAGPVDFVLGDATYNTFGRILFYASDYQPATSTLLGTGFAPFGPPPLLGGSTPYLGATSTFQVHQGPAARAGTLVLAPGPPAPSAITSALVIWPDLQRHAEWLTLPLATDVLGSATLHLTLPPLSALEGLEVVAQAWFPGMAGLTGSFFTNGLLLTLGW